MVIGESGMGALFRLRTACELLTCHNLRRNPVYSLSELRLVGDEVRSARSVMLTKWFYPTRLETRTKESSNFVSVWVANLYAE